MYMYRKTTVKTLLAAGVISSMLMLGACSNTTGSAGQMSYFTEGVITDIEQIDITKNKYDTTKNAGLGAIGGAIAGQAIGHDTKGTVIGAGIGAVIGGLAASIADQGDGMRLTVKTDSGLVLVDQPYSCLFKVRSKVRLINQNGSYQVQVFDGTRYRTATQDSPSKCPL